MKKLGKYLAIARISAKSDLAYAGEVGGRLFFLGIILYIFMRLWKVTYANACATAFNGYSLNEIIWYLALTESIMMSSPRITPLIDEDVRTGAIAVQLVRPLSYPLYRLASNFGEQTVRFLTTAAAAMTLAIALAGIPDHLLEGLACMALALPLAFVLDFLGYLLVGLCAFWLEDTTGLALIYSRLTMIAGGMLLPLELFPDNVKQVLRSLPFPCIVWGPSHLLVHPNISELAHLIAAQLLWTAAIGFIVALVYRKALRRISLHGG